MKKLLPLALALTAMMSFAGEEYPELPRKITDETPAEKAERMAWWQHDRFGMFIHFGLYAVPGRHEWVQSREYIDPKAYAEKYMKRFNPDLYDAKEWARMAKAAGMKYAVLTTKHHEGFCMWDTKTTDYKITNTEFGRDLVREYVDALGAERVCVLADEVAAELGAGDLVVRRLRVPHAEALVVLRGEDGVLHAGGLRGLRPGLRIEEVGIEVLHVAVVLLVRDHLLGLHPLVASGDGVEAEMDEHAEAIVLPPGEALGLLRGRLIRDLPRQLGILFARKQG